MDRPQLAIRAPLCPAAWWSCWSSRLGWDDSREELIGNIAAQDVVRGVVVVAGRLKTSALLAILATSCADRDIGDRLVDSQKERLYGTVRRSRGRDA